MTHKGRVLLVTMPFGSALRPSIGLSLLKATLERAEISAEVRYLNVAFAARMPLANYERIANTAPERLLGDWLFAEDLFGGRIPPADQYLAKIWGHLGKGTALESSGVGLEPEQLRAMVGPFMEACLADIAWDDYAIVGFTSTFQQTIASLALARRLKSAFPHLSIVLGGANCHGEMGLALHRSFEFVDHVCTGEGEVSFTRLAEQILEGKPKDEIPGIVCRLEGRTIQASEQLALVTNLDELPTPDYSDFVQQCSGYLHGLGAVPSFPVETSRGCWWGQKAHCTFCGLNGESMVFRRKSPERALEELTELATRYRARHISAVDNIIDLKYFTTLLPALAERDLGVELFYETKANLRKEQVYQLHRAGVMSIQPGIESFSSSILRSMRKGVTGIQNIQLLRWCAEFLVKPLWNLLVGFPGETQSDYAQQIDIIPLLTHLPPPEGGRVVPLRVDRFSPFFVKGTALGIRNVRPSLAYDYVYPLPAEDLSALAYYFRFDYADGQAPPFSEMRRLNEAVAAWAQESAHSRLCSFIEDEELVIYDTRTVAVEREHRLNGTAKEVYLFCDRGRTASEVDRFVHGLVPGEAGGSLGRRLVGDLVDAKLMLSLDDRYLSLAVSEEFRLARMQDRHEPDRPASKYLRAAWKRGLDPRTPSLAARYVREFTS